jgi:hypothetical protein
MKEQIAQRGTFGEVGPAVDLKIVPPQPLPKDTSSRHTAHARRQAGEIGSGIEVREEELGSVSAQRVYKMRCDCGRSWFELELPTFVQCPACAKPCLVSM